MTKDDKIILLHFFTRTAMYIGVVEQKNMMSFLYGYEIGRKNECNFLEAARDLLAKKYKIPYPSTGLIGQIDKLSKKSKLNWIVTFKRIAFEVLTKEKGEKISPEIQETLRTPIKVLIGRISTMGNMWYDETWKDQWKYLVYKESTWLKKVMTKKELSIIYSIDNEITSGKMYKNKKEKIPTNKLVMLKDQFETIKK